MSVSQKENLLNYDVEYITSDKHEIKWWLDKLCEIRLNCIHCNWVMGTHLYIVYLLLQCSVDECVRYQYSKQRREVDCLNEFNNTFTNDSFCSELGFPPDNVRDCYNTNCTMEWKTSKWSEVSEFDKTLWL